MNFLIPLYIVILLPALSFSQDLEEYFPSSGDVDSESVMTTFLGERIISGPSVEIPGKGELNMIIAHRFGRLDGGLYELFGLDQATMRMGFDYGISDRFAVGIGRSSFKKVYDFNLKYRILHQKQSGNPISITIYSSFDYTSLRNYFPENNSSFLNKGGISILLPISRKFGESLALQLCPAWHRSSYVPELDEEADIIAIGTGGRLKLTNMIHLTAEYYSILSTPLVNRASPLSFGFDLDTGGHLFQLVFSNSQGMTESVLLSDTRNKWRNGGVYFGFNLIRVFYLSN